MPRDCAERLIGRRRQAADRAARDARVTRSCPLPRYTAAIARERSPMWSVRSRSPAHCAMRSSVEPFTTPICSSARVAPERQAWRRFSPPRSTAKTQMASTHAASASPAFRSLTAPRLTLLRWTLRQTTRLRTFANCASASLLHRSQAATRSTS